MLILIMRDFKSLCLNFQMNALKLCLMMKKGCTQSNHHH